MAVSKLVGHVSGGLSHICAQDGMEQQFVDTVLLHALACAYGVIVLLLQDGCGPTALGPHLHEEIDQDCAVVDLVNDYDFWAVVESRIQSLGVPLGPLIKVISPYSEPRQRQTHKKQCRTWGRWAWAWWLRRRGRRAVDQRKGGEEDVEEEDPWVPQPHPRYSEVVNAHMNFCMAGSRWRPWSEPTQETVLAIQAMARQYSHVTDVPAKCLARRRAMEALVYEAAHQASLPETMRYQSASRTHPMNPTS